MKSADRNTYWHIHFQNNFNFLLGFPLSIDAHNSGHSIMSQPQPS